MFPPPTTPLGLELSEAIATAARNALSRLFRERAERFYFCGLITTGEGSSPVLSAWSEEALARACMNGPNPAEARKALRWSHADSPYFAYGEADFAPVKALFARRLQMNPFAPEAWALEWQLRVDAMEAGMAALNAAAFFGRAEQRSRIVVNVEVVPPDSSNTARAIRLNPPEALTEWLAEAGER
jgi:hypothetical protein